jgi:HEAT repeat protein
MKRLVIALALIGGFCLLADEAWAHGGSFRGPNGGVPPGMREPSDPEPPPPPPSDPGDPGGPTTPGTPTPGGPETPGPDTGHDTGDTGGPPAPNPTGPGGKKPRAATKSLTFESWRFWWGYNNDDILNLKTHIYSARVSSSSSFFFTSKSDEENRQNALRPTEQAIRSTIIPALLRTINRPDDHEDIHGGAIVALGKIGNSDYIEMFRQQLNGEFKNDRGTRIDYGSQATESAVLALGLLPNLDAPSKAAIRSICLEALDNEKLRARERCWAAVAIGLQQDTEGTLELYKRLSKKYPDDNIPAGILCGIGLAGDAPELADIKADLVTSLDRGNKLAGRDIGGEERIQAFVCYALQKMGDVKVLPSLIKVMKARSAGRVLKRSAAAAVGVLASKPDCDPEVRDDAVKTLSRFIQKSGGDASGENFAIIGLSQIGTDDALNTLIEIAENGKYGQRPFAALGLGTHVFYKNQAASERGDGMNPDMLTKITEKLVKLSHKFKDSDTQAAFMLARGLIKDKSAVEELTQVVSGSGDPTLRGFCCVALGLVGDASENVKDALKLALQERKSVDLRRDAATGLGLLRDAEVAKTLLEELKKAKSFAVQGQLITAIGTIGDHTAIDDLVSLLDDKSQPAQTRAMAAVGLGMIGDLRKLPGLARLSKNYNYRASVPDLDELLFIL